MRRNLGSFFLSRVQGMIGFAKDRYYIVRWLKDGGFHLYPVRDGVPPQSFTLDEATEYICKWCLDALIVNGSDASHYPVPKRW